MKKNGFILHITTLCVLVIFGIFSLFSFVMNNSLNLTLLEKRLKIQELDLINVYSTVLYEFSLIDSYLIEKRISSKEEYIYGTPTGERLWNFYNSSEKLSIGGFSLNSITPNPNSLTADGFYTFKMDFLKNITLLDNQKKPFLKVYIYTEQFNLTCSFEKKTTLLSCNETDLKLNNFRSLGEVLENGK